MSHEQERARMVDEQLRGRGINDERVLGACGTVPRHLFVPKEFRRDAYADHPLPIGAGQTISQPFIVALMTQLLRLQGHERVLEVGGGSGYQTAILSELALDVYTVERVPELATSLLRRVQRLGCMNVHARCANGSLGWSEHAPFDGIVVSAAAPHVPEALTAQLGEGGRMVMPVGPPQAQVLIALEKRQGRLYREEVTTCVFVPLIGEHGWPEEAS